MLLLLLLQLLLGISENGRMPISGMQQQEQPMVVGLDGTHELSCGEGEQLQTS